MSEKPKYTKEELRSPDAFLKFVAQISGIWGKFKKQVISAGVVALSVFVGAIGYYTYSQYTHKKLVEEIDRIDYALASLDYTSENDVNVILGDYRRIVTDYADTNEAAYASMKRANIFGRLGLQDKLLEELQQISGNTAYSPLYRAMAVFKTAEVYRNAGRSAEALEALNGFTEVEFEERKLFELALTYLQSDNPDAAKENFKKLTDQYPESVYTGFSQSLLSIL